MIFWPFYFGVQVIKNHPFCVWVRFQRGRVGGGASGRLGYTPKDRICTSKSISYFGGAFEQY